MNGDFDGTFRHSMRPGDHSVLLFSSCPDQSTPAGIEEIAAALRSVFALKQLQNTIQECESPFTLK